MRLWLLNRIRWLAKTRRPEAETGSAAGSQGRPGSQGRHRRGQRRGAWDYRGRTRARAGDPPAPGGPRETLAPAGSPARGGLSDLERGPADVTSGPADVTRGTHAGAPAGPAVRGSRGAARISRPPAVRAGGAQVRIREAPADADEAAADVGQVATPVSAAPSTRPNWYDAATSPSLTRVARRGAPAARSAELPSAAAGVPRQSGAPGGQYRAAGRGLPRAEAHPLEYPLTADGRRNCGSLEGILWRQWDAVSPPPAEIVAAIDRLAELPERIKERLANGLDAIFVGPGGVPELDDMTALRGVPLPSGQASWDACAGAYGQRKVVVGSQPSPTPDVMCHEVGHALDDLDSPPGKWQSDSAEFRMLYDQCQPHLASDFHRQPGGLGRKEFFADAFAAIASRQRPALVDMLSGDTRTALRVMLYFNRRYGI